ncbi:MAG TPA: lytic murein transglycosylase B [Gammaproteobacteria bacterium]|nr:lytic murein transglycosylase B [Gammaproteobacteria bacterium]
MKRFDFLQWCAALVVGQLAAACPALAQALDPERDDVRAFIEETHKAHGIERDTLRSILALAQIQPPIIEAISRPAERVRPWHEYRDIFMTEARIAAGVNFWQDHRARLERVAADTGVPPEILVGIIGVETFYGRIIGRYRVLDALATLAFEYPPRGAFFSRELAQFLLLAREQGFEIETPVGSYAGAMGLPQFIPSSYRAYAVDGDGDGRVDLWGSVEDIFASVANYFGAHGWRAGEPVVAPAVIGGGDPKALAQQGLSADTTVGALWSAGIGLAGPAPSHPDAAAGLFVLEHEDGPRYWAGFHNFYVITRYNRSLMYALAVHQLGTAIRARIPDDADAD